MMSSGHDRLHSLHHKGRSGKAFYYLASDLFDGRFESASYHIQHLVGIWSRQEGIGGSLSLPEVSMKQLDLESVYGDEVQRVDRQPTIEMNIFATAEEGSKDCLSAGGST